MRIRKVRVEGFRLFQDVEIMLEGNSTVIVGRNNSGDPRDLLHCRGITVNWGSGTTSKILLDQGMGYWRDRIPHREQMGFDFNISPYERAL